MNTLNSTPITGAELDEWKMEGNRVVVICQICSGDGLDFEDSSEDCYNCGGTGRLSANPGDWRVRTLRLIGELERLKRLTQKVHEWYWERQDVPFALEEVIDEIDGTTPMLVKTMQVAQRQDGN